LCKCAVQRLRYIVHAHLMVSWLRHFAGRGPVGKVDSTTVGPTLRKCGIRHVRLDPETGEERETYVLGGACSEMFSGPRLARVLAPGIEMETRALHCLEEDGFAETLSVHTSAGLPPALPGFLAALARHLPWSASESDDWFCSLQLEGGTAVFAGIDLLMQLQQVRGQGARTKVAVAERSYHGPPATSPGAPEAPLFPKTFQLTYPAPTIFRESEEGMEAEFVQFLAEHGPQVSVILFEPQWGSSNVSKPWPPTLLRRFTQLAHEQGILVLCDEIMCGLGRHGQGCCFLSQAWSLDADAVIFGKAVASGIFPLSGVALRKGAAELQQAGKKVMHMHTYAGSGQRALLAGTEVLALLSSEETHSHISMMGSVLQEALENLEKQTEGFVRCQGQGLMWGGVFSGSQEERARANQEFRAQCLSAGVWPYFVPVGGFQITPVLDVKEEDLREGLRRLSECISRTLAVFRAGGGGA